MYSCSHVKSFLSKVREHIVISGRKQPRTMAHLQPKTRPVNLVMHSQCKEETSSSSFGSRVNPGNDDERKTGSMVIRNRKSKILK